MTPFDRVRARLKCALARFRIIDEFCHDCGRRQEVVWTAPDGLWAEVVGREDGGGVLCPGCFDIRAAAKGIVLRWVPNVEVRLARDTRSHP